MQRTDGLWYWAEYSTFSISDEVGKYQLTVDGYSGDAGNTMMTADESNLVSNGMVFTTVDDDNDAWAEGNCAQSTSGGWWYGRCSSSALTKDSDAIWTSYATHDVQASSMLVKLN